MIKNCRLSSPKKLFRGFTLIEILIAVTIISALIGITILVIKPDSIRKRVRDAQRKKDLEIIALALEQYYADNNKYPNTNFAGLTTALTGGSTVYLKTVVPSDPTSGYSYCYQSSSAQQNQNFVLCAVQEANTEDRVAVDGGNCDTTPVAQNSTTLGRHCITNPL